MPQSYELEEIKHWLGPLRPGDIVNVKRCGIWINPHEALSDVPNYFQDYPVIGLVIAVSDDVWLHETAALVLLEGTRLGWIPIKAKAQA